VHYHTIKARDEFFYFFYNISRRYYIVNNFTQKIDVEMDNLHVRLNFNLSKEKGIEHNS
jgi:hypothetical protein